MGRRTIAAARLRRLGRDRRGASLLEFGLAFPVLLTVGGYGIELANFFLCNLRVSQYALDLADNASRVDKSTTLREYDVNDALTGAYLEGRDMGLTTNGRVTLSSVENVQQPWDTSQTQRVHWQRCLGLRGGNGDQGYDTDLLPKVNSDAGTTSAAGTQGADAPDGYGASAADPSAKAVNAPTNGAAMYAEINYEYQPIFGDMFMKKRRIHYAASFVVRDVRDFSHLDNIAPVQGILSCDKHVEKPPAVNAKT